jgi:hypothetical protein
MNIHNKAVMEDNGLTLFDAQNDPWRTRSFELYSLSKGITYPIWLKAFPHKACQQVQDMYFALVREEVVANIGNVVQGEIPATTRLHETPAKGQHMALMQVICPNPYETALLVLYDYFLQK